MNEWKRIVSDRKRLVLMLCIPLVCFALFFYQKAMDAIPKLRYAEVHSTVILSQVDAQTFRKLGMGLTCEPKYQTKKLYHN